MKKRVLLFFILLITQLYGCSNHASEKNEIIPFDSEPYSAEETETKEPETHTKELPTENDSTENTDKITQNTTMQPEENETEITVDESYYNVATDIPRAEVESYAAQIKQQFLKHDWTAISSEISYPITIAGITYSNSADFLAVSDGFDSNLSESFFAALEEEDCLEMFCNWQGIMLGETGQVLIGEVLDEELNSQGLKIIAINGLFIDNHEASSSAK